ncbi:MAG: serine/threonine protein kinase [Candidatus Riflebacteria bacterium]|nr:serine/threonine protein kinase [Candidatus Riflebacteria bacterium]
MSSHDRDYELVQELGRGGMGVVHLARQRSLDRLVAIKVILVSPERQVSDFQRFRREAGIVKSLVHPNLARLLDFDLAGPEPYLVFEYVEGGRTLADVIHRGNLPVGEVLALAEEISSGLAYMHERKVLHRDLKPGNILLDPVGNPKIIDLGLARSLNADETRVTLAGQVLGTVTYMPPEQLLGQEVDASCDVYSFGLMLYELAAGCPVFTSFAAKPVTPIERLAGRIPPRARLNPRVPPTIEKLIGRCIAREPEARLPDGTALLAEFARIDLGRAKQRTVTLEVRLPLGPSEPRRASSGPTAAGRPPISEPSADDGSVQRVAALRCTPLSATPARARSGFSPLVRFAAGGVLVAIGCLAGFWMGHRESASSIQVAYVPGFTALRIELKSGSPRPGLVAELTDDTAAHRSVPLAFAGEPQAATVSGLMPGHQYRTRLVTAGGVATEWATFETWSTERLRVQLDTRPGYLHAARVAGADVVAGRLELSVEGKARTLSLPWTARTTADGVMLCRLDEARLQIEDRTTCTLSSPLKEFLERDLAPLRRAASRLRWKTLESCLPFRDGEPVRRVDDRLLATNLPQLPAGEDRRRMIHALRVYLCSPLASPREQIELYNMLADLTALDLALWRHRRPQVSADVLAEARVASILPGQVWNRYFHYLMSPLRTARLRSREGKEVHVWYLHTAQWQVLNIAQPDSVMGIRREADLLTGEPERRSLDQVSFDVALPSGFRDNRLPCLLGLSTTLLDRGEIFELELANLPPVRFAVGQAGVSLPEVYPGIVGGLRCIVLPPGFLRAAPRSLTLRIRLLPHPLVQDFKPVHLWCQALIQGLPEQLDLLVAPISPAGRREEATAGVAPARRSK